MSTLPERIADLLITRRRALLLVAATLAAAAAYPATHIEFDRAIEDMFPPGHRLLGPYLQLKETFGGNEVVLAVYEDAELFDPSGRGIERQAELSRRLAGLRGVQGDSVFAYRFDWDEEPSMLGADLSTLIGAAHLVEVPFVFRQWNLGPRTSMLFDETSAAGRAELSDAMMSYWAEFAYAGAPGRGRDGSLPPWGAWDGSRPSAPKFAVLDTSAGGGIRMSSETESAAALALELSTDGAFATAADRCGMWDAMTGRWPETAAAPGAVLDCANAPSVAARE